MTINEKISRRGFIGKIISLISLILGSFFLTDKLIKNAFAKAELASKTSVRYRNYPNKGEMCNMCVHFMPSKGMKMNNMMMGGGGKNGGMMPYGTCHVVEGKIDPMGWCILYKPKMGD